MRAKEHHWLCRARSVVPGFAIRLPAGCKSHRCEQIAADSKYALPSIKIAGNLPKGCIFFSLSDPISESLSMYSNSTPNSKSVHLQRLEREVPLPKRVISNFYIPCIIVICSTKAYQKRNVGLFREPRLIDAVAQCGSRYRRLSQATAIHRFPTQCLLEAFGIW